MIRSAAAVLLRRAAKLGHRDNHQIVPLILHVAVKRLERQGDIAQQLAVLTVELPLASVRVPAADV